MCTTSKMKYLNEQDFEAIEIQLGVKLPQHYKDFHLNERSTIYELRESDANPEDHIMWIATNLEHIIEYNRFSGIPKENGPARNKFYIGGDGCGSSCFIELNKPEITNVYFICPDNFEEIFDETEDDFKWDNELVLAAFSLKDFARKKIIFHKNC